MDKKYSSGNQYISDTFSICNYEIYLNNRYYNPMLCRFITPDNYEYLDINNRKTLNLYAYCYNNPSIYFDNHGKKSIAMKKCIYYN